jgi:hypothetical protein
VEPNPGIHLNLALGQVCIINSTMPNSAMASWQALEYSTGTVDSDKTGKGDGWRAE